MWRSSKWDGRMGGEGMWKKRRGAVRGKGGGWGRRGGSEGGKVAEIEKEGD